MIVEKLHNSFSVCTTGVNTCILFALLV
uniref:Uncharacterized protein n=1 Tax=Anguilla anguilla TaxID=7936 RepID=A0A0E9Q0Z2_ANGAN